MLASGWWNYKNILTTMDMMKTIHVTGNGAIHVVPDVTRLEIRVDRIYESYEEAYKKAKENSKWIHDILEYNGKNGKMAKTTRMDIREHTKSKYDIHGHHDGYVVDGYSLDQNVRIDLGIDNVLLNKIVRGIGQFVEGADIHIGYTVMDPRPAQLKMLERAVKDARDKAEIMAKALGCKLGDVLNIDYGHHEVHVYAEARNIHSNAEASACTPDSLDITPEDLSVNDNVKVEWELIKATAESI